CHCGSGKKYKKCCLNLEQKAAPSLPQSNDLYSSRDFLEDEEELKEMVIAGDVGDYGTPVWTEVVFDEHDSNGISAYDLAIGQSKNPDLVRQAERITKTLIFRGKEEARKIKRAGSPEQLVEIMLSRVDPLNHGLLLDRILERPASTIPLIIIELAKPQRHSFGELAVQAIYRSNYYPEDGLLKLVTKPNTTAYGLSLICLLLGMLEIEEAIKPLWDCYHFLKEKFPHRDYWKGPLNGLADIKYRQDHPIEITPEQSDLIVQSLQASGIRIDASMASRLVTLLYTRRVLKLFKTFSEILGDPGEDEQAQNEFQEKLMAGMMALAQTVKQFPQPKQESEDEE
ncbi:MAG TPA: SEC-C domain-containing protein, partial [Blastocatellia bacterium]|nr:SEC-C domain-containing protein [Blastocatellia bacterium]